MQTFIMLAALNVGYSAPTEAIHDGFYRWLLQPGTNPSKADAASLRILDELEQKMDALGANDADKIYDLFDKWVKLHTQIDLRVILRRQFKLELP